MNHPVSGMTLEAGPEPTQVTAGQDGAAGDCSARNAVPRAAGAAPTRGAQPPGHRGWTLAGLNSLASAVVASHRHWWPAGDIDGQHAAAWDGITEHLLTSGEPPSRRDLYTAGLRSLAAHVRRELAHAGHGAHSGGPNAGAKFAAYWHQPPLPGFDEAMTERMAVGQILEAMPQSQRQALHALAATGDYAKAAAALGVSVAAFEQRIHRARARFGALWHEGETPPSGQRRPGRRPTAPAGTPRQERRRATQRAAAARYRARKKAAARAAGCQDAAA